MIFHLTYLDGFWYGLLMTPKFPQINHSHDISHVALFISQICGKFPWNDNTKSYVWHHPHRPYRDAQQAKPAIGLLYPEIVWKPFNELCFWFPRLWRHDKQCFRSKALRVDGALVTKIWQFWATKIKFMTKIRHNMLYLVGFLLK